MNNMKFLVGGAALLLATSALAGGPEQVPANNSGIYVNANGGLNILSNSWPFNSLGWNLGGALGYRFSNNLRLELGVNYWTHNVHADVNNSLPPEWRVSQFNMMTVMGNAIYDFDFGSSIVPYIGAGLGWAHRWVNNPIEITGNAFAFQGIAGLDFKVSQNVRVGVSYHILGTANDGVNQITISNRFENQINLGLSYNF